NQNPAIAAERQRRNLIAMAEELADLLAGLHIPQTNGPVVRPTGDGPAVRREGESSDVSVVALAQMKQFPRDGRVQSNVVVVRGRRDRPGIGREGERIDAIVTL